MSTETKRYSSHTILQNFNLPTKQRCLLSTATHWRLHSNVFLSSAPLVQRPNAQSARRLVPDDTTQQTLLSLAADEVTQRHPATPVVQHDPQSWNLVDDRPPTNLRSSHCCRRRPCRTFPYRRLSHQWTSTNTPHNVQCQ